MTSAELTYDVAGLVPAVIQEAETGEVLMVAWMNREAVDTTLTTGLTHFWSRSRGKPWRKGETSGHAQHVRGVYADCDGDTLLVQVHQDGVACHTGNRTCFFAALASGQPDEVRGAAEGEPSEASMDVPAPALPPAGMLGRLEQVVRARKAGAPAGSYVGGLLAKGEAAVCRKIGEEAVEVVTAALGGEGDRRVIEEIADLWFHTIVLLGERGIPLADVLEELARRHHAADGHAAAGHAADRGGGPRSGAPAP
jgi:phosphoribosyl-ATP pyrophosphohydrolase/phosphoribosyl-AMP cyclohydrolase